MNDLLRGLRHALNHLVWCICLILVGHDTQAHIGRMTIARSVEGIRIDGKLDDWPSDPHWTPIERPWLGYRPNEAPRSPVSFILGFDTNENALYLAIKTPISETSDSGIDACVVTVNTSRRNRRQSAGEALSLFGNLQLPGLQRTLSDAATLAGYSLASFRTGTYQFHEFRIPFSTTFPEENPLAPAQILKFGIVIRRDPGRTSEEPLFSRETMFSWGIGFPPFISVSRDLDDVLLVGSDRDLGELKVQFALASGEPGRGRESVAIYPENSETSLDLHTDIDGALSVRLPVGEHYLRTKIGEVPQDWRPFTVDAGTTIRVTLDRPMAPGKKLVIGPPKIIRTGKGWLERNWRYFSEADGIFAPEIEKIVADNDGNIWLGTRKSGLLRFDGAELWVYDPSIGFPRGSIQAIFTGRPGELWIEVQSGWEVNELHNIELVRFDGREFSSLTTADGLPTKRITARFPDSRGNIWVGALDGTVARYDGNRFITFTTADGITFPPRCFAEDADGRLWVGTRDGAYLFDGTRFVRHHETIGDSSMEIVMSEPDNRRGLLFGTSTGLFRFDGVTFQPLLSREAIGAPIEELVIAPTGGLVLRTAEGLLEFDGKQVNPVPYPQSTKTKITAMAYDRDDRLWLAVEGGGIGFLDPTPPIPFRAETISAECRIHDMAKDPAGDLLVATSDGIFSMGGNELRRFKEAPSEDVRLLHYDRKGALWFMTDNANGFTRNNRGRLVPVEMPGFRDPVTAIAANSETDFWVGTAGGQAFHFGDGTFSGPFDGVANRLNVNVLFNDSSDRVWVGTEKGATAFTGKRFETLENCGQLSAIGVRAIAESPDGTLWFGTKGRGLFSYAGGRLTNFTSRDGLAANTIHDLCVAKDGTLWMALAGGGVGVFDGTVFQRITRDHGLPFDSVRHVVQDNGNDLWLATDSAVIRYHPRERPPKIRIRAVTADRVYADTAELAFSGKPERLAFEFIGASFTTHPDEMVYVCRVEGIHDWRPVYSEQTEYNQDDFDYGKYVFEVKAVDRDINYSEPARVKFHIRPAYGQLALVGGLGLALVGGSIAGGIAVRVRRQRNRALLERNESLEVAKAAAEREKEAANSANRAKSLFLANMSHEIRTPMNAILGYSQILQRDPMINGEQRRSLATIGTSGDHLLAMINDILNLSKIEAGRMELHEADFDLGSLIEGLAGMFRIRCEQKDLELHVEIAGSGESTETLGRNGDSWPPLPVHGDEGKLRQVLINLLGNAVKFTERGSVQLIVTGPLTASSGRDRNRHNGFDAEAADSRTEQDLQERNIYRFEVIDTGPGVSEQEQEEIFQPFHQASAGMHNGGTGLGLAITHAHVALMGGKIDLDSTPAAGSRFRFEIPLRPARQPADLKPASARQNVVGLAEGTRIRAVIVDDIRLNRDVLSHLLSMIGCEVRTAESASRAFEMIEREIPDVVFMDIRMPKLDGTEAARQLIERHGPDRIKIVAITASVLEHEKASHMAVGFHGFLPKPFRFEDVCECLGRLLGVEFEYAQRNGEPKFDPSELHAASVTLPESVLLELKDAVRCFSVTRLDQGIGELENDDESGTRIAEHLRGLIHAGDLESVGKFLDGVRIGRTGRIGREGRE